MYEILPDTSWTRKGSEVVSVDRLKRYYSGVEGQDPAAMQPPPADADLSMAGDEFAESIDRDNDDEDEPIDAPPPPPLQPPPPPPAEAPRPPNPPPPPPPPAVVIPVQPVIQVQPAPFQGAYDDRPMRPARQLPIQPPAPPPPSPEPVRKQPKQPKQPSARQQRLQLEEIARKDDARLRAAQQNQARAARINRRASLDSADPPPPPPPPGSPEGAAGGDADTSLGILEEGLLENAARKNPEDWLN